MEAADGADDTEDTDDAIIDAGLKASTFIYSEVKRRIRDRDDHIDGETLKELKRAALKANVSFARYVKLARAREDRLLVELHLLRDASERAEAVRRCQLRGDLRQARAGSRPLQGAYRAIGTRRRVGSCFVPGGHRTGAVHRRCYVARADRHLGSRRLGTAILYFQKRPSAISSPIPTTHPTHYFPHLHSTGKRRVPRRRRRVLPLRAPRHQPHRQRGRYPGLLETAAEDARLLAT